jgi:hypothetical protein
MQYIGGLGILIGIFLLAVIWALIAALPVMLLWNWIMPDIFSLPEIGLFKAWGLAFLCSLLFKSGVSSSSE